MPTMLPTKPSGTCNKCHREGLRIYRQGEVGPRQPDGSYPGWVWGHGPKGDPCTGSWEAPAEAVERGGENARASLC